MLPPASQPDATTSSQRGKKANGEHPKNLQTITQSIRVPNLNISSEKVTSAWRYITILCLLAFVAFQCVTLLCKNSVNHQFQSKLSYQNAKQHNYSNLFDGDHLLHNSDRRLASGQQLNKSTSNRSKRSSPQETKPAIAVQELASESKILEHVIPVSDLSQADSTSDSNQEHEQGSSLANEAAQFDSEAPSLAEIAALGTAVGLMASEQVGKLRRNEKSQIDNDGQAAKLERQLQGQAGKGDKIGQKEVSPQIVLGDEAETQQVDAQINAGPDQVPDSIESLMGSDLDDVDVDSSSSPRSTKSVQETDDVGPSGQADWPATDETGEGIASRADVQQNLATDEGEDADDDDNDNSNDESQGTQIGSNSVNSAKPMSEVSGANQVLSAQQQNSVAQSELDKDLSTAAGHHYGKKKKKKKVIIIKKKKKKKVKKKKKKVKKKKKKKIIIIKKKKKKKYHPKKHHVHDHGKYYMYAKVPKKKTWEFGFKKGNKKHWIERHEKGHKNKFKTKVMWYDKKSKGKGMHIWDYNHHDKKKKKHHG